MSRADERAPAPREWNWTLIAVAAVTLLGVGLRLARLDQSVVADELSTLFIVRGNDLPGTISAVASDAEISPPLYFILAWFSSKLGSAPELVRLPSMIAGTLSIPLVYLVGRRAVGRTAGLLAAAVMALSPFMIFYSTEGRSYAILIALLLGSTLALLIAASSGRTRWWVAYGVLSCLAVYSHYTATFVLAAQLGWLLWKRPAARRPALLANAIAAVAFLPWLPSAIADTNSPTTDLLEGLQGSGFAVKRAAVEVWAFGYPGATPAEVPGHVALVVAVLGLALAATTTAVRRRSMRSASGGGERWLSDGEMLVLALALATAVVEGALLLLGVRDLFGARDLNASSGGLALAIGAVLAAAAGSAWRAVAVFMVIGCFAFGATKTLGTDFANPDLKGAAAFIESEARPGDVILDGSIGVSVTPVPLTALDASLTGSFDEYRLALPSGPPPFLPFISRPTPAKPVARAAVADADRAHLFVVGPGGAVLGDGERATAINVPAMTSLDTSELRLPPGSRVVAERRFPGREPINVFEIELGPLSSGGRGERSR